jgi:integrin-linked kinase-associated serine/threonine phosphatase 2C
LKKNEDETTRAFTIELTVEHSASVYEERQRILKNSGYVDDGRVLGVLEVSRSIGDGALKAYGVTCVPDVRKCLLNSNFKFELNNF